MKFTKMEGCGNDYIYINLMEEWVEEEQREELSKRLSDRHFGVGGDGVIYIGSSSKADLEMIMYNADGSRGRMCGNGIRCVAKFALDKGLVRENKMKIESMGEVYEVEVLSDMVRADMGAPKFLPNQIPFQYDWPLALNVPMEVAGVTYPVTVLSMGNPHAVVLVDDLDNAPVKTLGPILEKHSLFPEGVNVEFVKVEDEGHISMRVWERGSGETYACGTGACASLITCVLNGLTDSEVDVKLLGGVLFVKWDMVEKRVLLTGPAKRVFEGYI